MAETALSTGTARSSVAQALRRMLFRELLVQDGWSRIMTPMLLDFSRASPFNSPFMCKRASPVPTGQNHSFFSLMFLWKIRVHAITWIWANFLSVWLCHGKSGFFHASSPETPFDGALVAQEAPSQISTLLPLAVMALAECNDHLAVLELP